ncbi:ABC transporter permease [Thalassomonas actiniarum]|uniref:ABC transporter permease n=1 Tax=Thalassomonas actiniarum TaxID=485447 RepID=A0AAE9YRX4_9GAMM|nr:ABC transporter permease [Thalassomonas actiniarum]WDE00116.1 ABC transporter permease [Thalassomonas actiniarum]
MIQFNALLKKELKEAFRDKRALMYALMMAFMAPVMIYAVSNSMIKDLTDTPALYVNIQGGEAAPKLMTLLRDENILPLSEVPADEQRLWQERNIELILPESFAEDMREGRMIDVILRADYQDKSLFSPLRRIKEVIRSYSATIGSQRLLVRGIDVRLMRPVKLLEQDTAEPTSGPMLIILSLGMYLMMAAFVSGLSVAIDSSAGERERNVLEMLLSQPVDTMKIVLAKLSCASFIAVIGVILTLVLTHFAIGFVDLSKIGATFNLDFISVSALLLLLLPLCFFASALQLFFAFGAKSFKEAQSTVTMVVMLPAFVPFVLSFMNNKPQWLDWTPISGQSMLIEDIFKGLPVNWSQVGFTTLVTVVLTAVLVKVMAEKLKSEKVVLALS